MRLSGIIRATMNHPPRIVVDTNVLVAALRSRQGASFRLLSQLRIRRFEVCVTVPLVMEYADVLGRPGLVPLSAGQVDSVLDMLCREARQQAVHYLWRPQLRDPKDEMVLEAAVNARADFLVTHNGRDFASARFRGLAVVTPAAFLAHLEKELR